MTQDQSWVRTFVRTRGVKESPDSPDINPVTGELIGAEAKRRKRRKGSQARQRPEPAYGGRQYDSFEAMQRRRRGRLAETDEDDLKYVWGDDDSE